MAPFYIVLLVNADRIGPYQRVGRPFTDALERIEESDSYCFWSTVANDLLSFPWPPPKRRISPDKEEPNSIGRLLERR